MNDERITVLVVDDHDLLREGVAACLAGFDDLDVVGEASTAEAAIDQVAELRPAVVVIDLVMPGLGGVAAIGILRESHPDIGLLALSSYTDGEQIREALEAGANGYLVKSVDAEGLARGVRRAAAGEGSFSEEVTRALVAREVPADSLLDTLTPREAEIAGLVAEGRSNGEIAADLELSVFTVKNHVSSVLMKLRVQSRTEAAAVLLRART